MQVYFDNAATTPVAPEVIERMTNVLETTFGNPSSLHAFGRNAKTILEQSRRTIAQHLNCEPKELIFTSGGTEADNMVIANAVECLKVERIVTTSIEHHAVELTAQKYAVKHGVELCILNTDDKGNIDLDNLRTVLSENKKTLVTLMHANNEIATLIDLNVVGNICREFSAYFHSDTVQTMGHYNFDLKALPIDFMSCAGHKFHGPKGSGFLYVRSGIPYSPLIFGGSQERGFRAGTESIHNFAGLAKAFDLAYENLEKHQEYVLGLKQYFIQGLQKIESRISFNGEIVPEKSLYTVLNVAFPPSEKSGMLLFALDLKGIACSGGSACSAGSNTGSHVIRGIAGDTNAANIRFSFSRYNTKDEVDYALKVIAEAL